MTAFIPMQAGVLLPSDINDLGAAGIADGEFAKRVGGAWAGAKAVENALISPSPQFSAVRMSSINLPSGNAEFIPAIPSGYKFSPYAWSLLNATTSSIAYVIYTKQAGISYIVRPSVSIPARSSTISYAQVWGLYPNDSIILNLSAGGASFFLEGLLIPDTGKQKSIFSPLVNGNNTIYTCPAGRTARVMPGNNGQLVAGCIGNLSIGVRIYSVYVVPNGGSPAASNLIALLNVSNSGVGFLNFSFPMNELDSLVVSSDGSGTQGIHVNIVED